MYMNTEFVGEKRVTKQV